MSKNIQLSLLLVALSSSLYAQNQYTLENISVTASHGTALDKKDITDTTTIITKEAIEESRSTNLAQALNSLGNLAISQNGGAGGTASIFMRGMDSKRTLVLIDGVRVNSPASTGIDYAHIMLHNVEQIEIIKGAQSGIWGAQASAGVINIITAKAKQGLHTTANLEYGVFNTTTASVQTSFATQNYDILIGGSVFDTDGFSTAEPVKSSPDYGKDQGDLGLEKDPYNNKSFNAKFGFQLGENDRLEMSVQTINSFVKFDDSSFIPPYSTVDSVIGQSYLKDRFYSVAYKHKDKIHDLQARYNLSTFDQDGTSSYGGYRLKGSVGEIKLSDKINYLSNSFLRFGASHQTHKQEAVTTNTDRSFTVLSAFVTNYNKINLFKDLDTIVTESVRYDKYNKFDNSFTGKLGIKQFLNKDFYISTNIGTGFNTPTLGQLYGQWGSNPNLKPEKSLTTDITLGNDTVWITGFYNEVTDLIEYTSSYVQATGTSTFRGIELGYEDFLFDSVGIKTMYTYLEAKNADNQNLQRRPKHQVDVSATYYVSESFDLGLSAQYIGQRYDLVDNTGAQTGKYFIANFITNFKATDNLTLYAKLNNLSDKHYQTVDGYATEGISAYIGLNAKF